MKQGKLSGKILSGAARNNEMAADIAELSYVTCSGEGIHRTRRRSTFKYFYKGKEVNDKRTLQRIRKLAIPPSWSDVWICPWANGHIQATGLDLKKRKQYRYHADWMRLRNETKFHRLYEFGTVLPRVRNRIKRDISRKELTENKVLASAVSLLEQTHIRVGNNGYEKLYGSYGLTTLKDNHVRIKNDNVIFSFTGKKRIQHKVSIKNRRLAKIIRQCRDIPGKELFQYYSGDGNIKSIDSGMLNNYIREAANADFSAKDFRTWAGSLIAVESFKKMKDKEDPDRKRDVIQMLDEVSHALGNTRNICKKYYVHPRLIELYEENKFFNCLKMCNPQKITASGLSSAEKALMWILKK